MARTRKYTNAQIIEALNQTHGMVYIAAKKIGCSPDTIYIRAKKHPAVQAAIDNNRGVFVDTAELALAKAVQRGEGWAVCFALKTLGKKRGYVEKQKIETSGEINVNVNSPRDELIGRLNSIAARERTADDTKRIQ